MDKMGVLNIIVMCIIWQINSVGAQEIRPQKAGNLKAVENWVLYIKLGNDEVCAGVQLSDDWVLTLADCIDKKIKLTKYSIVHKDGSRKVIAEDRDSFGKLFILLKMTDDKEATKTKFAQLADSMSPSSEYKFSLYNRDNSDKLLANEVDFVRGSQCEKEEIDGNFGETHKCVQGNMNKKARCLPGSPVFGSKKKQIILQGLAVTSTDSCSSQLQSIAVIKPQINWINSVINDCGPIKTFRNGKVKLNKKSSTAIGATASIMCDPGYEATQKKISCKENGKWEKSSCELKDCGSVENIKNGKLNLDDATKSTMGATATVVCDPGYKANQDKIKCLKSGKWGKSSCEIKDCGPVENVRKGKVILDNNTESTVGAKATLECFPGYKPNQKKIVCLNTGKWEESRCKIKDCGTPASVINGNLNFTSTKFGATASVICDEGSVSNQKTISCLDTGNWETPTCTIIDCGSPENVTNGALNFTTTTFGSTAAVVCDNGYAANKTNISCLETGSWETTGCKDIRCKANNTCGLSAGSCSTPGQNCYIDDVELYIPNVLARETELFEQPIASEEICREMCYNATSYRCVAFAYYGPSNQCMTYSKTPAEGLKTSYHNILGLNILTCLDC
ncbi:sushi, von Willebrand factor type A, EGF and pentraxin domain-containing protein 1-like [Ruditapes philippinarum]|uniref:sushi, von Willebrand factor type A, EGF and pentraxin domain-containing protein 1-like n=1 Tax=Ruditapes philippinarum TaxID=129788 RepID=UPI00295A992E|nr:sushi, von Willebrand factor type A, EGF and pentraxin domain-containing protein 1-like [Ruditapes philippinarum]